MKKQQVSLTNWYLIEYLGAGVLFGKTKGHPRFHNGTEVRTSRVIKQHVDENGMLIVETKNTIYTLDPKEKA
jgi:hypothetical protein